MAQITVAAGSLQVDLTDHGSDDLVIRIYNKRQFIDSDGQTVVRSRMRGDLYYEEVPCVYDENNDLVLFAEHTLDSHTDAVSDPYLAAYNYVLYGDGGRRLISNLYKNLRVPHTANPTTLPDIVAYNQSAPGSMPDTYYTAAQVNALLALRQLLLVSGVNIKTVGGASILGPGDLDTVTQAEVEDAVTAALEGQLKTINGEEIVGVGNILVQALLESGVNIKSVGGVSILGPGNIPITDPPVPGIGVEAFTSAYASLDAAVADIGATPTTLLVDSPTAVNDAVVVPATLMLRRLGTNKLVAAGGTVEFEGYGLTDPTSPVAIFSGFAPGDITWSGSDFPPRLSASLWDDADLDEKLVNAIEAVSAITAVDRNSVTVVARPGTINIPVRVREGVDVHLTAGTYYSNILAYGAGHNGAFIPYDRNRIFGDGMNKTFLVESPNNQRTIVVSGIEIPSAPFRNYDIAVHDICFMGNPVTTYDSAASSVNLGNTVNGQVRRCAFLETHGFALYVGGFDNIDPDSGADGAWLVDNYIRGLGTQYIGTIGGRNIFIDRNVMVANCRDVTPSMSIVDIEPNYDTTGSENVHITNNIIDARLSRTSVNGITVQRAYSGNVRNVRIAGNTIIDRDGNLGQIRGSVDVNTVSDVITLHNHGYQTGQMIQMRATTLPSPLGGGFQYRYVINKGQNAFQIAETIDDAYGDVPIDLTTTGSDDIEVTAVGSMAMGIQAYSIQDLIVENNNIIGGGQYAMDIAGCFKPTVQNNRAYLTSSGIRSGGNIDGVFKGNVLHTTDLLSLINSDVILEEEALYNLETTAASPIVTVLDVGTPLPWWYVGQTVEILGVDYTVLKRLSDDSGRTFQLSANVPSTNASTPGTFKVSSNRYIDNEATVQISPDGTSIVKSNPIMGNITIHPATVEAGTVSLQTFALPGAEVGDAVSLNPPAAGLPAGLTVAQVYISAADVVAVAFENPTGGDISPPSAVWKYTLIR